MKAISALAAILVLVGCQSVGQRRPARVPLHDEGETYVYLQPPASGVQGIDLGFGTVSAVAASGAVTPLEPPEPKRAAGAARWHRLVASGRLAPGSYVALLLHIRHARIASGEGTADLLVPQEPVRVDVEFTVRNGQANVIWLAVRDGDAAPARGIEFAAKLSAREAERPTPPFAAPCSASGANTLFVIDTRAKLVSAAIATGVEPKDVAPDARRGRAFVALAGEDAVGVVDLAAMAMTGQIRLQPHDEPRSIAVAADGRTLLAMNYRSGSVSFVDVDSFLEVGRLRLSGDDPVWMQLHRDGVRAYVLSSRPSSITAIDVATQQIVSTVPLEAEPVAADLNRAGDRIYVAHRGHSFLSVLSIPQLAVVSRAFVGLGVTVVKVDPRTGLLYLGRADGDLLEVYDPLSLVRVDAIGMAGPVAAMAIDDVENVMFAVIPSRREVVVVDLTSKRVLARLDVGEDPFDVSVPGERD